MTHYIVVEGPRDDELLRSIIPDDLLEDVRIVVAGGKNSALPLANSIAVAKQAAVALVVDADTENEDRLREEELDFQDFVSELPVDKPPVLFLGVPNLETSVHDQEWVDRLNDFLTLENYALENPFQYRR